MNTIFTTSLWHQGLELGAEGPARPSCIFPMGKHIQASVPLWDRPKGASVGQETTQGSSVGNNLGPTMCQTLGLWHPSVLIRL